MQARIMHDHHSFYLVIDDFEFEKRENHRYLRINRLLIDLPMELFSRKR